MRQHCSDTCHWDKLVSGFDDLMAEIGLGSQAKQLQIRDIDHRFLFILVEGS